MNKRAHYIRLYRRLGLDDNATLKDLKNRYHHLASKHHPDKLHSSDASKTDTTRFQEIQSAYHELKTHHAQHSTLPLEIQNTSILRPKPKTKSNAITAKHLSRLTSLFAISIFLFFLYILYTPNQSDFTHQGINESNYANEAKLPIADPSHKANNKLIVSNTDVNHHPIVLDMKMGMVFDLLGAPDVAIGNSWYYGESEIIFRDGKVAGWIVDPASTIKTDKNLPLTQTPVSPLR